jgi:2-(1,2-epoxy-1,2-dihydrophenyl)acetyl-CoA isomerase
MSNLVEWATADGVATVRLNRPDRLNAFDANLHAGLRAAFDAIEAMPDLRAVILTGNGRAFCAGQDLAERAATFAVGDVPDLGRSLAENYNPLIRRIAGLPAPVIAAVNGIASGAGAAVAIACDLVVASTSARFQFGFVRVALGPDAGTTWSLPRRVGAGRALAIMLTGEPIDAPRALAIGLCDLVVPDEALLAEADRLARQFADGPIAAIQSIKLAFRSALPISLEQSLTAEEETQRMLGRAADYRAAVTAFAAKKTPRLSGKEYK